MHEHSSRHAADAVRDDIAGAPCRWPRGQWEAGEPFLAVDRTAPIASAATIEIVIPHEAGAMAVPLRDAGPAQRVAGPREIFGAELAGFARLETFGVAARLTGVHELALFKVAPSHALRLDDTGFAWGGGEAVAVRFTAEIAEAVARAVRLTRWPPRSAPRVAFSRTEAR